MHPKPPASTTLLVLDNNKYRADLLSRRVVKLGHQVVVASNGRVVTVNSTLGQG